MSEETFQEIVEEQLQQIRNTLLVKGKEYRRNSNPFHNFDQGARRTGKTREEVLDGFLLKHEISIEDITRDAANGKYPTKAVLDEKFGDNIIYLILKKASLIDRIEKNAIELAVKDGSYEIVEKC